MSRVLKLVSGALFLIPATTAQITGGGFNGSQSILGLISNLIGINFRDPYSAIGFAATMGLMWVSIYIIFKIGVKRLDEGLGNDSYSSNSFAESLGIDDSESRNLLAVLSLLVVLSMLGTGAFLGLVRGWQSLIVLVFLLMLLAGLILVLFGGAGGLIGLTAYTAGTTAKVTAHGVEEALEHVPEIQVEETEVEEIETDIETEEEDVERRESDVDDSGDRSSSEDRPGEDSRGSEETRREIEDIIVKIERAERLINDIEDRIGASLESEIDALKEEIKHLRELAKLLGIEGESELLEELKQILNRIGLTDEEIRELLSLDKTPEKAREDFSSILEDKTYTLSDRDREVLSRYMEELQSIEEEVENIEEILRLYSNLKDLLTHLEEELRKLEDEEHTVENLISNLEQARRNQDILDEIDYSREELEKIKEDLTRIEDGKNTLEKLEDMLENFIDSMSSIEDIKRVIKLRELLMEALENLSTDYRTTSAIGFNRTYEVYPRKGMTIYPVGQGATVYIDEDLHYDGDTERSTNPMQLSENNPKIVEILSNRIKEEIRKERDKIGKVGRDKFESKEILEFLERILQSTNIEMQERSKDIGSGRINFSVAEENQIFESGILNCLYLGFLIEEFKSIYNVEILEPDNKYKIGTWGKVRKFIDSMDAKLVSYRDSPMILLDIGGDKIGLHPESDNIIRDIDESLVGEIRYNIS